MSFDRTNLIENVSITLVKTGIENRLKYSYNLITKHEQEQFQVEINREQYELLIDYYKNEDDYREENVYAPTKEGRWQYKSAWLTRRAMPIESLDKQVIDFGNHQGAIMIIIEKYISTAGIRQIIERTVNQSYSQQFPLYNSDEFRILWNDNSQ